MSEGGDETTSVRDGGALRRTASLAEEVEVVFYYSTGVRRVQLVPGTSIVVGRAVPADVVVKDATVSRRHARLTRTPSGLWLEDLESSNGTRVGGVEVSRGPLVIGDRLLLGEVVGVVQSADPRAGDAAPLVGYDQLVLTLEHELRQARVFNRSLTLAVVASESLHVSQWIGPLCAALGAACSAGHLSERSALIVVPQDRQAANATLRAAAGSIDAELDFTMAAMPEDGASAHELLEAVHRRRSRESMPPTAPGAAAAGHDELVVASAAMAEVVQMAHRVATADAPVLITGETGTGKELISRLIHDRSRRREGPLVPVNCAAIPASLLEATLFGHERGAFTGAESRRAGVFERASGGTLFLDEVGELSPRAQAALLRVLETGTLMRVGGIEPVTVDVRVIAATHRNLAEMAIAGDFRSDLLYRLNTFSLEVPPLRRRPKDLQALVRRFLAECGRAHGRVMKGLTPAAQRTLEAYRWPGNVRECRNAIERAVVVSRSDEVDVGDLPESVCEPASLSSSSRTSIQVEDGMSYDEAVRAFESRLIERALTLANGVVAVAARQLGMDRSRLTKLIKRLEIR